MNAPLSRLQRTVKRMGLALILLLVLSFALAFGYQVFVYYQQVSYQQQHPEEAFASYFTQSTFGVSSGPVVLPTADDDPSVGPIDAPVQIIAFEDFECPFSQQFFTTVKSIEKDFPNDVRFIYRDYPIDDLHTQARLAAEAAECADEQNAFWAYHDILYLHPNVIADADLKRYAAQINLDVRAFTQCFEQRKFRTEVQKDLQDGIDAGVTGTPTLFINGKKLQGAIPYRYLKSILEKEIEARRSESS